jgi:hypothetical protein
MYGSTCDECAALRAILDHKKKRQQYNSDPENFPENAPESFSSLTYMFQPRRRSDRDRRGSRALLAARAL